MCWVQTYVAQPDRGHWDYMFLSVNRLAQAQRCNPMTVTHQDRSPASCIHYYTVPLGVYISLCGQRRVRYLACIASNALSNAFFLSLLSTTIPVISLYCQKATGYSTDKKIKANGSVSGPLSRRVGNGRLNNLEVPQYTPAFSHITIIKYIAPASISGFKTFWMACKRSQYFYYILDTKRFPSLQYRYSSQNFAKLENCISIK